MTQSKAQEVKQKVSIPAYFYNVVIPQMSDYYSDYTVDFDMKPVSKCCLHDEDTPSLRYYEETNTFFCFGCRAGGDVIELHRKFTEKEVGTSPTFNEAIDFLYNYFIKGVESSQVIVKNKQGTEEYKSNIKDVIRLSGYLTRLEKQLLMDGSIQVEYKKLIWDAMDNINILVSKNKVNAKDAMLYIKKIIKENIK